MKLYKFSIGILATAVAGLLLWLSLSTSMPQVQRDPELQPTSQSVTLSADAPPDTRLPVASQVAGDATPESEPPTIESSWSDELVGATGKPGSLPHDSFGYPVELRPYLHRMMNMNHSWGDPAGRDPTSGAYVPKLHDILQSLPKGYSEFAKQHEQSLAEIVRQYALAAHTLEIEH
jgi:hypothetical protein